LPNKPNRLDWYTTWVAAGAASLFLFVGLVFNISNLIVGEEPTSGLVRAALASSPEVLGAAVLAFAFSVVWFWLRMLVDYFQNLPRHAVGWGLALFFLNVLAALYWFWRQWKPRHSVQSSSARRLVRDAKQNGRTR
jgi:protein-S-isoprenylcysteine O-methyltransferase Ste14